MTPTLRQLLTLSSTLVVVGTTVMGLTTNLESALGVALSGGLVLLNLVLWIVVGRHAVAAVRAGRPAALAGVFYVGKLALLVGGLWLLSSHFPPAAVLTGASVLVASTLMVALSSSLAALRVAEA